MKSILVWKCPIQTVWLGYLDLTTHTRTPTHTPRGGSRNSWNGGGGCQGPRKGRSVGIFKLEYVQQESGLHCMPPGGRTSTNHLGKRRLINQYNPRIWSHAVAGEGDDLDHHLSCIKPPMKIRWWYWYDELMIACETYPWFSVGLLVSGPEPYETGLPRAATFRPVPPGYPHTALYRPRP